MMHESFSANSKATFDFANLTNGAAEAAPFKTDLSKPPFQNKDHARPGPLFLEAAETKKEGPYRQANSGTDQEGTIQNIEQLPDNVKYVYRLYFYLSVSTNDPANFGP
jgi:hypothetical protein